MERSFKIVNSVFMFLLLCTLHQNAWAQVHPCMGGAWRPPGTINTVPVYWNPGTLAANGFDVDSFRESFRDALAVWNEESQANLNLYYAGDTTATDKIAGAVVVVNQDIWDCNDNMLAKAWNAPAGQYNSTLGQVVRVILKDSCSLQLRPWVPAFGGDFPPWLISYEKVLVHELGHAVYSMPDRYWGGCGGVYQDTIMFSGRESTMRHLFPIDINSARSLNGGASGSPVTIETTNFISWGPWTWMAYPAPSPVTRWTPATVSRPSAFGGNVHAMLVDTTAPAGWMRIGQWDSWVATAPPSNAATMHHQPSIAFSNFGEVLAVWPVNCTQAFDCQLAWAWSNNDGATWTTGTTLTWNAYGLGTPYRPEVAYDPGRDRFVAVFIEASSGKPFAISTEAWSVAWTGAWPLWPSGNTFAPLRYLGGMVFANGEGLLVAATDSGLPLHGIVQMSIAGDVYGTYLAGAPMPIAESGSNAWFRARRPFGLSRNPATGAVVMAWRSARDDDYIAITSKAGLNPATLFPFRYLAPYRAMSGVDVAVSINRATNLVAFIRE